MLYQNQTVVNELEKFEKMRMGRWWWWWWYGGDDDGGDDDNYGVDACDNDGDIHIDSYEDNNGDDDNDNDKGGEDDDRWWWW